MNRIVWFLCVLMMGVQPLMGESSLLGSQREMKIAINNRILAKANGKAISVVDVMKKMDMLFYQQFPQFVSSPQARYQFYTAHWKRVLAEMIDKELIMADAEESKLQISPGDVRQEMEATFGPNIITNLDKAGLSFDEAYQMILADITLRRMMYFRVQMKALSAATPQKIRQYYDEVAKTTIRDNEWVYHVITIRNREATKAESIGKVAYTFLVEDKIDLKELEAKLRDEGVVVGKSTSVGISEEYHTQEKELSDSFRKILNQLTPGSYSEPIVQKSRTDNSTVVRIFFLKETLLGGPIPFQELEGKIKMKLVEDGIEKESEAYITKLRQHFDVQDSQIEELFSSDFQPFSLK